MKNSGPVAATAARTSIKSPVKWRNIEISIYPLLSRLRRDGLVETVWRESNQCDSFSTALGAPKIWRLLHLSKR